MSSCRVSRSAELRFFFFFSVFDGLSRWNVAVKKKHTVREKNVECFFSNITYRTRDEVSFDNEVFMRFVYATLKINPLFQSLKNKNVFFSAVCEFACFGEKKTVINAHTTRVIYCILKNYARFAEKSYVALVCVY